MGARSLLPNGAIDTSRYGCRQSEIAPRRKIEGNASPKSVIADVRFISPASSSSSIMDCRPQSDATSVKLPQPRLDRGYAILERERSDGETLLESTRNFNKVCAISGSLEPLLETQPLALKATRANISTGEENSHNKPCQTVASLPAVVDKYQIQRNKGPHQAVTSSDLATVHDATSIPAADNQITSESSRSSFRNAILPQNLSVPRICHEKNRERLTARGHVDHPGTPARVFSGCQSQSGSPLGNLISFESPGVEMGIVSYSAASLVEHSSRGKSFQHRLLSSPLHGGVCPRPPPSKWDDAEKWISSRSNHELASPQPLLHRPTQALSSGRRHFNGGHCLRPHVGPDSLEVLATTSERNPSSPTLKNTNTNAGSLTRCDLQKRRSKTLSFGDLSKRVFDISRSDEYQMTSCLPKSNEHAEDVEVSSKNGVRSHETQSDGVAELNRRHRSPNQTASAQSRECVISESLRQDKSKMLEAAKCSDNSADVEILKHTLTESMEGLGSHQLGTPIAADVFTTSGGSWKFVGRTSSTRSQKSSTCTTSACATSPSRHNTPARPGRRPASFGSTSAGLGVLELRTCHLAKLELCKLGGKDRNVIVWSTQQEEDVECSVSLRDNDSGVLDREFDIDFAAAQEESAKQTKKIGLFDKEEARIKAWEELQMAKAEAEMQKLEMKLEKMRIRAHEKMSNRIALARKKAEQMRASAHEKGSNLSTLQQVEQIRDVDHFSSKPKPPFKNCFKA